MHDILRDRERCSVRLVMTPDRMVVAEAMRTFTYLSLYGYLTDAVVVNRVFPDERRRDVLRRLARAPAARARARARRLRARAGAARALLRDGGASGDAMLDRLGEALFDGADPAALLHDGLAQEFGLADGKGRGAARACPSPTKGDVALKKVGDELVVRVDGRKRTVVLPPRSPRCKPAGAALDDGVLVVRFA